MRIPVASLVNHFNQPNIRSNLLSDPDYAFFISVYDDSYDHALCTDRHLAYWFSEVNKNVAAYLKHYAGFWDDGVAWHYDPTRVDIVQQLMDAVSDSYENENGLATLPSEQGLVHVWTYFGLSGDDDVDYNGGYLATVIEIIQSFLKDVATMKHRKIVVFALDDTSESVSYHVGTDDILRDDIMQALIHSRYYEQLNYLDVTDVHHDVIMRYLFACWRLNLINKEFGHKHDVLKHIPLYAELNGYVTDFTDTVGAGHTYPVSDIIGSTDW